MVYDCIPSPLEPLGSAPEHGQADLPELIADLPELMPDDDFDVSSHVSMDDDVSMDVPSPNDSYESFVDLEDPLICAPGCICGCCDVGTCHVCIECHCHDADMFDWPSWSTIPSIPDLAVPAIPTIQDTSSEDTPL